MARRQPNPRLAALLNEAHWNPAQLARAVNDLGAAQGLRLRYDRSSVAHWLSGSRPRPPIPDLVASAFSRRSARLVTAEETGLTQPGRAARDPVLGAPLDAGDTVARLAALTRSDSDPARRSRLVNSAYDLAATTGADWKSARSASAGPHAVFGRPATAEDVQRLHRMTDVFADLMERHGGAHARTALTAYVADDTSRLLAAPARPALRRELFAGASQLTHLLARMSMDAGHPSLAQHYFTASLSLARDADNRRLFAITLRAMSLQAVLLGFHDHARHLADAAVETAGRRTEPATRAFLLSQRALTSAHTQRRREAVSDLAKAEKQHDRASGPAGPFTNYPRSGLDYQHGKTLLTLGDTKQAARLFAVSAEARPDNRHRSNALTRARLADTLLTLGHLDESCGQWHAFLDHYPSVRSVPADHALRHLRTSLRSHGRHPLAAAVLHRARGIVIRSPRG